MTYWIIFLPILLTLTACREEGRTRVRSEPETKTYSGSPLQNLVDGCVEDYKTEVDYFPDKVTTEHARIFRVAYRKHYKVLRIQAVHATSERAPVSDTIVLVQCGTPVPDLTGDLSGASIVSIPARSVACNDNCDIAAIDQLGLANRLVAIGGGNIYNEEVWSRWSDGQLATIGYAWHGLPNLEVLLLRKPDVLFMRRASLEHGRALTRARRVGIAAAPTLARSERHYLGFAEWVKYFSVFFNAEESANQSFSTTLSECRHVMKQSHGLASKRVFWAGYAGGGLWSAARSPDDLRTRYLDDIGVDNPLRDIDALPGGMVTNEQLLKLAGDADYWISDNTSVQNWPNRRFLQEFRAWREGRIFHHEKRSFFSTNRYDWYETGAMRPELVLQDLLKLVQGADPQEMMFFDHVRTGD